MFVYELKRNKNNRYKLISSTTNVCGKHELLYSPILPRGKVIVTKHSSLFAHEVRQRTFSFERSRISIRRASIACVMRQTRIHDRRRAILRKSET